MGRFADKLAATKKDDTPPYGVRCIDCRHPEWAHRFGKDPRGMLYEECEAVAEDRTSCRCSKFAPEDMFRPPQTLNGEPEMTPFHFQEEGPL